MMTPVNSKAGGRNSAASPSVADPQHVIQEIVAGAYAPKIQGRHISNHHLAEQLYIHRQGLARSMGLPSEAIANITPYPTPVNNTTIVNDNQPLLDMLAAMLSKAEQPRETTEETPISASVAEPGKQPRTLPRWLLPLVAALGIGGTAATTYVLWPDSPPPIQADYEVKAR